MISFLRRLDDEVPGSGNHVAAAEELRVAFEQLFDGFRRGESVVAAAFG